MPGSKVLRRQGILNLHERGMLGDPMDPKVSENVLTMLEYGDIGEVWKDHSLDMAQIQKHLELIEEGIEPPVSEFDNHKLFIQEFNRYRKSDKYMELGEEEQTMLLANMNMHLEFLTDIMDPDAEDPDAELGDDPDMIQTTTAQEQEAALMAEEMPQEELPPGPIMQGEEGI